MSKESQEIEIPQSSSLIEKIWANSEDIRNAIGMHILEIKQGVRDIKEFSEEFQAIKNALAKIYALVKGFDEKLNAVNMGIADILDNHETKEVDSGPDDSKSQLNEPTENGYSAYYKAIREKTGMSIMEIHTKIDEIVDKFAGLMSKEGAFKELIKELQIEL